MEFQLSYFKSWKMMLLNCCTQYASKFGKLSSGHRTGKGQFSFQSQRKSMPKNAQNTTQLHSSFMVVRKWQPTPVFLPGESQGRGAWWASVYGVTQSHTWLKRLSSSSSNVLVWTFFGIAFLWDWNDNWPFPVLWPLLSFPYLLAYWVRHFHSIIF